MKKIISVSAVLLGMMVAHAQNVGIGTTTPAPSAQLDVSSTKKGFLPPRMTFAQRNLITNPATGLVIWCSDCGELQVYNGTIWQNMTGHVAAFPSPASVNICNQIWTVKNLTVSNYRNGDPIPQVTDPAIWSGITIGAWCWYNNDSATYAVIYGKLYNGYAVNDPRGLAPTGWHIPTDDEFQALAACLGGVNEAGGKMKQAGTAHWANPNTGADNSSGFSAVPAGSRYPGGVFADIGMLSYWYTSTNNETGQLIRFVSNDNPYLTPGTVLSKMLGISVRCVKD